METEAMTSTGDKAGDRVEQLACDLSEALRTYMDGRFQARIAPGDSDGPNVVLAKLSQEFVAREPAYGLSEAQSDMGRIAVLLDIALDEHFETRVDEPHGRTRAERISALLWASRDIAERGNQSIEASYAQRRLRKAGA